MNDVEQIVQKSMMVLEDKSQLEKLINNGLTTVSQYDWCRIAKQYESVLYLPILPRR
jgi:glycosyltransferase involved in cell wall biosynthesis